jgi:hypothetical protein
VVVPSSPYRNGCEWNPKSSRWKQLQYHHLYTPSTVHFIKYIHSGYIHFLRWANWTPSTESVREYSDPEYSLPGVLLYLISTQSTLLQRSTRSTPVYSRRQYSKVDPLCNNKTLKNARFCLLITGALARGRSSLERLLESRRSNILRVVCSTLQRMHQR